ncbi:hypothetical protein [Bradyrhizobium sp. CCBAU 65884]|uniref:hypothetical protein n=1 Tax=Bradyrhizobium sp. CCBAU 65884 TaxID=722477 RepID=UPI002304F188|nr:hypothetical protein [Bradyrhizobium sp. CCBAU 65884]
MSLPEIITNGGNAEFVQRLDAKSVAFLIVGGAAVAAHGCRDISAVDDLDIVIDPTTDNVKKFIAVLAASHIDLARFRPFDRRHAISPHGTNPCRRVAFQASVAD